MVLKIILSIIGIALVVGAVIVGINIFTDKELVIEVGDFDGKLVTCFDSDGVDINKKGTLKLINEDGELLIEEEDKCNPMDQNFVLEAVCFPESTPDEDILWIEEEFRCENTICQDGRCL